MAQHQSISSPYKKTYIRNEKMKQNIKASNLNPKKNRMIKMKLFSKCPWSKYNGQI